ncbi:MAG TPA: hypothetical protein VMO52_06955 [Acidimicrobiia bacterium]|nr:hypothetical protein [Acidimicrobiia bacterium]
MSMWSIRIAIVLLVVAAIGISVMPILVLLDLLEGGTGWGLCPDGLEACDSPYTTPFEFLVVLAVGLFAVVLAIRVVMKLARRLQAESFQVSAPESQPPPG